MQQKSLNNLINEISILKSTNIISSSTLNSLEDLYIKCFAMLTNELLKVDSSKKEHCKQKLTELTDDALLYIQALINSSTDQSDYYCDSHKNGLVNTTSQSDYNCDSHKNGLVNTTSQSNYTCDSHKNGVVNTTSQSDYPCDSHKNGLVNTTSQSDLHLPIYLIKMKADFLKYKSKSNNYLISQSKETYQQALSLLHNHPPTCPYKLDCTFGLYLCNTSILNDQRSFLDLKNLYIQALGQSDFVTNKYFSYYSRLLRYIRVMGDKCDGVYECTLKALVRNNYNDELISIVSEEEFLRTFYFL